MTTTGQGELLVVEGANRVGKTTLVRDIVDRLVRSGVRAEALAFPGSEPATVGHLVHRLHKSPGEFGVERLSASSLQTLHVAAHLDAIERLILPRIDAGIHVVLDRYWWSTAAYGRVADVPEDILAAMLALESVAWRGVRPVLAILVDRSVTEDESGAVLRKQLRQQYRELMLQARSVHPAELVWNDGSIGGATARIIAVLAENGAKMVSRMR